MQIHKPFWLILLSISLGLGCGNKIDSGVSTEISESIPANSAENAVNDHMENKNPQGEWLSSIAPEYPLTLKSSGNSYTVKWEPTIDSDIEISGTLTDKGANVYHGNVHFVAGAEVSDEPLTLRFDPSRQSLSMEFPVMYEAPVVFERKASGKTSMSCLEAAEKIASESDKFQKLIAKYPELQLMDETEDDAEDKVFDFRLFIEASGGDVETLSRLRVDLNKHQVFEYDPIEDSYTELKGNQKLFTGLNCR